MNIPRDTEFYELTTHGWNKAKQRNISGTYIKKTIKEGHVQEANGGYPTMRFLKDFERLEKPIGVVANVETGEIVTVFHNTKYELPNND